MKYKFNKTPGLGFTSDPVTQNDGLNKRQNEVGRYQIVCACHTSGADYWLVTLTTTGKHSAHARADHACKPFMIFAQSSSSYLSLDSQQLLYTTPTRTSGSSSALGWEHNKL